jgi:hypothetical protein
VKATAFDVPRAVWTVTCTDVAPDGDAGTVTVQFEASVQVAGAVAPPKLAAVAPGKKLLPVSAT